MPGQKKAKGPTPWEIAKPMLREWYLDGTITDAMKPSEVYYFRPEFLDVKYVNFRTNFAKLKKGIKENKHRAEADEAGYLHDMSIYTLAKDSDGYWDGSAAQSLLQKDIRKKRHEKMKPEYLWLSRPEYSAFDLKKFRGHIHQELRKDRETTYWIYKKTKKKKAKEALDQRKIVNEDDMDDFYDPVLDM
eukprot:CAMPEP_0116130982 /NCGR_PEP_ID=MMETSP0329-20121206/8768_1 /TAXON_ID=697910 /ORGANISM="Pseudo-nitzschia arenysensis, Strain B593" /LENGTH=188 /DNA_ID=CAMNT_0003625393 /DNA_START=1541 /DNA_END=2107 /DNA_ORIENTATION=+